MEPVARSLIPDPFERSKFVARVGIRFNALGWGSLGVLALTGLYNLVSAAGGVAYVPALLRD
jgi:hypothetical protein